MSDQFGQVVHDAKEFDLGVDAGRAAVVEVAPEALERSLGKAKRVYDKRPKG